MHQSLSQVRDQHLARERATGIEPAFRAWEARVLPLNYARVVGNGIRSPIVGRHDTTPPPTTPKLLTAPLVARLTGADPHGAHGPRPGRTGHRCNPVPG